MKKQFITLILSFTFVALLLPTSLARAQTTLLPFGGVVSSTVACTCSPSLFWIWYTPLYLGGPIMIAGPMVYSPFSTILYGYYEILVSGAWHLGDYVPGVQACWMTAGKTCVVLPSIGLLSKVGTNLSE